MRKRSNTFKQWLINFTPMIGLVLIVVLFAILSQGKTLDAINIKVMFNNFIITAVIAISVVFVFGSGALDMSMGGSICLSVIIGAIVVRSTGSIPLMILATVLVSLAVAAVKGFVAAVLDLPVFIVTIVLGSVLSAIALVILGDESTISLTSVIQDTYSPEFYLLLLGVFYLLALILFNYTSIGKSIKLIGGNPVAARQLGISKKKTLITAFLMAGLGVALASVIILLRYKTASSTTASSVGTDIMVAVVLGGMPLSGGPRARISAGLIGAATITILSNGLFKMGLPNEEIQVIRGIVFVVVVLLASLNYRTKLLPR